MRPLPNLAKKLKNKQESGSLVSGLKSPVASTGVSTLAWAVAGVAAVAALLLAMPHHADATITGPTCPATPANADWGNYQCIDSLTGTAPYAPSTNWVNYDIVATGALIPPGAFGAADAFAPAAGIPVPFSINFYDTSYNRVYVHENGYIGFDSAALTVGPDPTSFTPATIPTPANPNNYVAGMFTDLAYFGCSGTIRYQTVGVAPERDFVVQWSDVPVHAPPNPCGPGTVTFQIRIHERSGDVLVVIKDGNYNPAPGGTAQGTLIGIEQDGSTTPACSGASPCPPNWPGKHGLQYFYQSTGDATAVSLSGRAILFFRDSRPVATPLAFGPADGLNEDCTVTTSTSGCGTAFPITLSGSDMDTTAPTADNIAGYCIEVAPLHATLTAGPPPCSGGTNVQAIANPSTFNGMGYSPTANYCGLDSFTYRVQETGHKRDPAHSGAAPGNNPDNPLFSFPAKVDLTIKCIADLPLGGASHLYSMYEDCNSGTASSCGASYLDVPAGCLGFPQNPKCFDSDPDDVPIAPMLTHIAGATVSLVTGPTAGTLLRGDGSGPAPAISLTGAFRYAPNSNFCGADSFQYRLLDDDSPVGLAPTPAFSTPITVTITIQCVNDPPTASFQTTSIVTAGDPVSFQDTSTDPDGSADIHDWSWDFGDGSTSTQKNPIHTYSSPAQYTVCLRVKDVIQTVGLGCGTVFVNAASGGGPANENSQPGTEAPNAYAGEDQRTTEGARVVLAGSSNEGTAAVWKWRQVSGPAVALQNDTEQEAYFVAPPLPTGAGHVDIVFTLVVGDGTKESFPDDVIVTVSSGNHPPVAKAGGSIQVHEGDVVNLDGSGSTDADGTPLTYSWAPRPGSGLTMQGANLAKASFTVPAGSIGTSYIISLTVSDGKSSNTDTVQVLVTAKLYTGPGFTTDLSSTGNVTVTPVVQAASYVWDFGDVTDRVASTGPATHTYELPGNYTITLTAKDASGSFSTFQQALPVTLPSHATPTGHNPAPTPTASQGSSFPIWGWFAGAGAVLLVILAMVAIAMYTRRR